MEELTSPFVKFWFQYIGDTGARKLADTLRTNTTVRILSMVDVDIGPVGGCALANMLCVNTTITEFILCNNNVGNRTARAMAEALRTNTTLKYIDMSNALIDDEGVEYLADALMTNTTLKSICLMRNQISDNGALLMLDVMKRKKNLEYVRVTDEYYRPYSSVYNQLMYAGWENVLRKLALTFAYMRHNESIILRAGICCTVLSEAIVAATLRRMISQAKPSNEVVGVCEVLLTKHLAAVEGIRRAHCQEVNREDH
jgi:hypothetical protein